MEKEDLRKNDIVRYYTLGLIRNVKVIENNIVKKELKIKEDFRKPIWVDYKEIKLIKE